MANDSDSEILSIANQIIQAQLSKNVCPHCSIILEEGNKNHEEWCLLSKFNSLKEEEDFLKKIKKLTDKELSEKIDLFSVKLDSIQQQIIALNTTTLYIYGMCEVLLSNKNNIN